MRVLLIKHWLYLKSVASKRDYSINISTKALREVTHILHLPSCLIAWRDWTSFSKSVKIFRKNEVISSAIKLTSLNPISKELWKHLSPQHLPVYLCSQLFLFSFSCQYISNPYLPAPINKLRKIFLKTISLIL